MADIKIISKQNGVAVVLPTETVFLGDPDGDYVAEFGALSTQLNIKRDIDTFYVVKNVVWTDIKDSAGVQIGTSRDNCVSVLNSDYFNRTSKIQELDNVDFQNTIAADQVLKFVDIGGGILRISNELEPDVVAELVSATSISAGDKTTIQTNIGVDPAGTDNSTDATVGATASDVLKMAAGQNLGAFDAGADKLVFWDDSDSKLTYATIGTNLTMTGTTLSASGGGGGGGGGAGGGNFMITGFTTTTTQQWYALYLPYANSVRTSGNWQHYQLYHMPAAGNIDKVSAHVQGAAQINFGVSINPVQKVPNNIQTGGYDYTWNVPYTSSDYTEAHAPTGWSFSAGDEIGFAFYNANGGTPFYVTFNVCFSFT